MLRAVPDNAPVTADLAPYVSPPDETEFSKNTAACLLGGAKAPILLRTVWNPFLTAYKQKTLSSGY